MPAEANAAKDIFFAALEKDAPADRAAYLDLACAGDAELRRRVEALLRAHDQADPLLDRPAVEHLSAGDLDSLDFLEPSAKPGSLGRLGPYEVLEVVGRGGFGVVLRAFDEKLHRVVAIKALTPALAGSAAARQRFVREARAGAAVTHENVVAIYAVEDAGRVPYLVMQFVEGRTLQEKLDGTGPLPLPETLRIGLQVAEGLAAAHKQGLVHRDIKPGNILLENGVERVKITDFGLARAVDDASLTQSGQVAGTPAYMSPEQAAGEKVEYRSDLFSLGSVLYSMCAGRAPFRAESALAVLRRVCDDTPRPLREVNPAVPEWLEGLVAKLQAKKPADRFATAGEVATILSKRLAHLQSGADPSAVALMAEPARAEPSLLPAPAARPGKRNPLIWVVLAVFVACAIWAGRHFMRDPSDDQTAGSGSPQPSPEMDLPNEPIELKPVKTLNRHTDGVMSVAVSPDGKVLASGSRDKTILLWDTESWQIRGPLTGHTGDVVDLVFSPDGTRLASVAVAKDTCFVRLWDVATAKPAKPGTLGGESPGMWGVDWSRDGARVVCAGWGQTVHVWEVHSGKESLVIPNVGERFVRAVAFSPEGDRIAAGGNGPTKVFDAKTGQEISSFPEEMCPSFLPSGSRIAGWSFAPGLVNLCDVPSGQVRPWRAHTCPIEGLTVSPDGRFIASLGRDGKIKVWHLGADSPVEVATLRGHRGSVYSAAFTPDGAHLYTAGIEDFSVRVWDLPAFCRVRKQ